MGPTRCCCLFFLNRSLMLAMSSLTMATMVKGEAYPACEAVAPCLLERHELGSWGWSTLVASRSHWEGSTTTTRSNTLALVVPNRVCSGCPHVPPPVKLYHDRSTIAFMGTIAANSVGSVPTSLFNEPFSWPIGGPPKVRWVGLWDHTGELVCPSQQAPMSRDPRLGAH